MAQWYRYAGLWVLSEIDLPEWKIFACAAPQTEANITIRWTEVDRQAFSPVLTRDQFQFRIQDVADYRVCAGRDIWIAPHAAAGEREIRLFLLGSAWGALCYQRGILALHMSVVEVNGRAVGFCGASGAGKSTCAAWLVAQGHPLIADDLCHIDLSSDAPHVYPAPARLKLWQEALDRLAWSSAALERDHFRMEKFHLDRAAAAAQERNDPTAPLPLAAIYGLVWGELGVRRMSGLAGLTSLVETATYRGELLDPMGQAAAHWERCASLVRRTPFYQFSRPQNWTVQETAMQYLQSHWADGQAGQSHLT